MNKQVSLYQMMVTIPLVFTVVFICVPLFYLLSNEKTLTPAFKVGDCIEEKPKVGEFTTEYAYYQKRILKIGKENYLTELYSEKRLLSSEHEQPISLDNNYEITFSSNCQEK